jgi:hypothetical protein
VFNGSTDLQLHDGSINSPDASLARLDHWRALSYAEWRGCLPLRPDQVVELFSPSNPPANQRRR